MKKLFLILMLLPLGINAQEKPKKNAKTKFIVVGNCDACQKRIEKCYEKCLKNVKMINVKIMNVKIMNNNRKMLRY